ncbi:MAG TPA: cyclopropane-fatty-acyl-phospholipid synthase family protein [Gemmatimonadales bacterium]|nr:cyclopropane-fatty-acyl-phospholipid synthase family protein [Gemmatimonadales bacterium]
MIMQSGSRRDIEIAQRVAAEVFGPPSTRSFAIRYWDGSTEPAMPGPTSTFTLVIKRPGALRAMLLPPSQLAFGEAFLRDDIDLEGDLEVAARTSLVVAERLASPRRLARLAGLLLRLPPSRSSAGSPRGLLPWARRHTRRRDAAAIRRHYDVGNEFFQLWLDAQMVYSCAYFPPGVESLDAAQTAKLDYICRKLRLRPGERLLDIGCGWGALIRHAVRRYGVEAVGITLSPAQAALATRRIAEAGLADRCRVELRDYRDIGDQPAYDKVASVGMVEHVGRAKLAGYFAKAFRVLRPGGLFLNHGIVDLESARPPTRQRRLQQLVWREGRFLRRRVFPNGELVPFAEVVRAAERAGFETRDAESLREHYVQTLRRWVRRLEARKDDAVALVGEATYRVWRLYMSAAAASFAQGRIGLVQLLVSKAPLDATAVPPQTRDELYLAPWPERQPALSQFR